MRYEVPRVLPIERGKSRFCNLWNEDWMAAYHDVGVWQTSMQPRRQIRFTNSRDMIHGTTLLQLNAAFQQPVTDTSTTTIQVGVGLRMNDIPGLRSRVSYDLNEYASVGNGAEQSAVAMLTISHVR